MKLTRLVHSCLLVEDKRANVLIDPGIFSWNDDNISVEKLPKINYILITHIHPDHCHPEFVKAVLARSPQAKVISNEEVAIQLAKENIEVQIDMPDGISATTLKHADLWDGTPEMQNTVFNLWGELTHFGDNRQLSKIDFADIVAFPVVGPWGSMVDAIDRLSENPPKQVVPIHDWHLSDDGRDWTYQKIASEIEKTGSEFIHLNPTDSIAL